MKNSQIIFFPAEKTIRARESSLENKTNADGTFCFPFGKKKRKFNKKSMIEEIVVGVHESQNCFIILQKTPNLSRSHSYGGESSESQSLWSEVSNSELDESWMISSVFNFCSLENVAKDEEKLEIKLEMRIGKCGNRMVMRMKTRNDLFKLFRIIEENIDVSENLSPLIERRKLYNEAVKSGVVAEFQKFLRLEESAIIDKNSQIHLGGEILKPLSENEKFEVCLDVDQVQKKDDGKFRIEHDISTKDMDFCLSLKGFVSGESQQNDKISQHEISNVKIAGFIWCLVALNYFAIDWLHSLQIKHEICFQVMISSLIIFSSAFPFIYSDFFRKNAAKKVVQPSTMEKYDCLKISSFEVSNIKLKGLVSFPTEADQRERRQITSDFFVEKPEMVEKVESLQGIEGLRAAQDVRYLNKADVSDIPYNWIEGCNGDRAAALKKWKDSLLWRKNEDIDNILSRGPLSIEKFSKIKHIWPQFFLGRDKRGNLVTLERFPGLDQICKSFKKQGVTPDDFASQCIFLNEYWIHRNFTSTGKLIKIMDVSGLTVGMSVGLIIKYFGRMNRAMQQYPEIMAESYFVNVEKAGTAFRILFKLLPRFMEAQTLAKIKQVRLNTAEGRAKIRSLIDPKLLPVDLGGDMVGDVAENDIEKEIAEYIENLTREKQMCER